jgi:hypothetical protein
VNVDAARGARLAAGLVTGPLALAAFWLRWADGSGPLAAESFSGYELVRFTGALQALDLSLAEGAGLWLVRLAVVLIPVAGAWQAALAPWHRWHPGYGVSGWYLVMFAAAALLLGMARSGLVVPSPGLVCLALAAMLFVVGGRRAIEPAV